MDALLRSLDRLDLAYDLVTPGDEEGKCGEHQAALGPGAPGAAAATTTGSPVAAKGLPGNAIAYHTVSRCVFITRLSLHATMLYCACGCAGKADGLKDLFAAAPMLDTTRRPQPRNPKVGSLPYPPAVFPRHCRQTECLRGVKR